MQEYSQSRIVCASLEEEDRGREDKELKTLAVKPVVKRKEAFNRHARRVYKQYRDCEYSLLDVSCLDKDRGRKEFYKEMKKRAAEYTHSTGEIRAPF